MNNVAIKIENLGKQYRLGEIGTGTLGSDLTRAWAKLRGREDPFAKVGETNDRTKKGNSDFVWSLRDVNFEVKQGEVLGIVGRNGAGKSTLLKILSKVTAPTTGRMKVRGRIASLLEVGTGFHPELTGRENIYLNGAILGMSKSEIRSKFDEIVDFSGVERYIDTPVKRYSSGMYVRLAFAVAAFLEPEILIIDEVLAVGDAEFQKKCLGRMKDVSVNDGRTVLFVSHSMTSVQSLCKNGLFLENGETQGVEDIATLVEKYNYGQGNVSRNAAEYFGDNPIHHLETKNQVKIEHVRLVSKNGESRNRFKTTENITIEIQWKNIRGVSCSPNFQLTTPMGVNAIIASDSPIDWDGSNKMAVGTYLSEFIIPANLLNANDFYLSVALDSHSPRVCYESHVDILKLSVWDPMDETSIARGMFTSVREDVILWPALQCSFQKID
ncbi:ABC transporter ATP-binding protein [Hymenobacter coccineus]|uniref:ABC transporter ATP-binding protein n=1 Tax=Hymenobacter coccineus TaxID=1908235 RepID=UPI0009F525C6|nr:ABC transporter ATP-binding protein [Hymenobacter coccineus]